MKMEEAFFRNVSWRQIYLPFCFFYLISIATLNQGKSMEAFQSLKSPRNANEGTRQSVTDPINTLLKRIQEAASPSAPVPQCKNGERQSRLRQGVHVPDARFNAFVDGVMVNMVAEMRRMRMDPLYFRVHGQGIVEHVVTRVGRKGSLAYLPEKATRREARQEGTASTLGGGVIQGLRNITRFGNAEVQVAGNATLVRSHWLMGPLRIIIDFRDNPSIRRVSCNILAVQFDTLTVIDRLGAEMEDCELIRPLFGYIPYYGNRTLTQQATTELVVQHLFSETSFMTKILKEAFRRASYDKIIPQYGADDNYYSMLKYLFSRG